MPAELPDDEIELLVVWGHVSSEWGRVVSGIQSLSLPMRDWEAFQAMSTRMASLPHSDKYRPLTDAVEALVTETAGWYPPPSKMASDEERAEMGKRLANAMEQFPGELNYVRRRVSEEQQEEILARHGLGRVSVLP